MEAKKMTVVPVGTSEKDIANRIAQATPDETLVFFVRTGMSMNKGGPLGGGAILMELNPNYKPKTANHKYVVTVRDVDGQTPVGEPSIVFSASDPKDLADRVYWRQIEL